MTLGNGITSIDCGLFSGCGSLESVLIPDTVRSIGEAAFIGCSGLENVTIGKGVQRISKPERDLLSHAHHD